MKRAAVAFALILVLLGAMWEVPRRLDWAAWRADLAWLATQRLGRIVYLSGPVRLALLPQPVIEAEGVELGGGQEELALKAQALRLRLSWWALLRGSLEPREIALVAPDLRLPWPPQPNASLRPPAWMTVLEARIERGRLSLGPIAIENVNATITTGGPNEALLASGRFAWRGQAMGFDANIGRPGWDLVAPMELNLRQGEAALNVNGALLPEGGFEGRLALSGTDLSQIIPAPAQPFRAQGRLHVAADLLSAEDLAIELATHPAKGAVTLRLSPELRLDIALAASRLDLDAWMGALRRAGPRPMPLGLDLSAEQASLGGIALRRLRGGALLTTGSIALSDLSALLPGELAVTGRGLAELGAPDRLTLDLSAEGADWRGTLAALGFPLAGLDPARLKQGEARGKLVITPGQVAFSELEAEIDGTTLSGTGLLRLGARPAIGLGLTLDTLDLARLWPAGLERAGVFAALSGFDANLRLNAGSLAWGEAVARDVSLDAALDGGRLALRRLSGALGGAQVVASGNAQLPSGNAPLRLADLSLEATAPQALGLIELLPGDWPRLAAFTDDPLVLRASGAGTLEALQARLTLELGTLRGELQGSGDLLARRANAALTLRHPGLPRLLAETLGPGTGGWLGEGSFSLIAPLTITAQGVSSEYLDLAAAAVRANGALSLAWEGARPRLAGRLALERLPLPDWDWAGREPLPFIGWRAMDADLALSIARLDMPGLPMIEEATGQLRLTDGTLSLADGKGRMLGGSLGLLGSIAPGADAPRTQLSLTLADLAIEGPLLGGGLDLLSGRLSGALNLSASGHGPAAMRASLGGEGRLTLRGGALAGVDLPGLARAAALPDAALAEAGMRAALAEGRTEIAQLDLGARFDHGRAALSAARLATPEGLVAEAVGEVDLPRGTIDLRLATKLGEAPEVALRLTGPAERPRRLPELAPWLRWKAAQ